MKKRVSAIRDEVEATLDEAGCKDVAWSRTGKGHMQVTWTAPDKVRGKATFSWSPSCYRSDKNGLAQLRAQLKDHLPKKESPAQMELLERHPEPWRKVGVLLFDANGRRIYE